MNFNYRCFTHLQVLIVGCVVDGGRLGGINFIFGLVNSGCRRVRVFLTSNGGARSGHDGRSFLFFLLIYLNKSVWNFGLCLIAGLIA